MQEELKKKLKDSVGDFFPTNQFGEIQILEYRNYKEILVKFTNTGTTTLCRGDHIKHGRCRDKFAPTLYGRGVVGDNVTKIDGVTTKLYNLWGGMLERCYSDTFHKKYPSYIDCYVSDEWLHLDKFKPWFYGNYKEGFELDKDLLVEGNKVYSKETCIFVPKSLNNLIKYNSTLKKNNLPTGVREFGGKYYSYDSNKVCLGVFTSPQEAFISYKNWKENRIKQVAECFYKKGDISYKLYNVLISYEVKAYV